MSVNFCWTTQCNGECTGQSKGKVVPVYVLKTNEGLEVQLHLFITSTLDGSVCGQLLALAALFLGKELAVPTE